MSRIPERRRHTVIAGTGRSGTSFLVRFFDACGLDCGLEHTGWSERARAGLEHALDSREPLPYVVKDPWLFAYCESVDLAPLTIDALIVPIRDLMAAAQSRIHQERLTLVESPLAGRGPLDVAAFTPGGVVHSLSVVDQARILAVGFHRLMRWATVNELPVYTLDFPRLVDDSQYTLERLWPWLGEHCAIERAREAFAKVAEPRAVRIRTDGAEIESTIPEEVELGPAALDRAALLERIAELEAELLGQIGESYPL
jgi:hypothetical protein